MSAADDRGRHGTLRDRLAAFALKRVLAFLGWLSFAATQRLGKLVGDLVFLAGGRLKRTTYTNIAVCFPDLPANDLSRLVRASLQHTGRFAAEFGLIWSRDDRWRGLITEVQGVEVIDDTLRSGKGVLVLVPHFGNWEILNLFLGARYGLTALYDPPRIASLDAIIRDGRTRTGSNLVPATARGIRSLYIALQQARVVGLLPDQVPHQAAGAYVPFFGRPALTMTLAYRLESKLAPRLVMGHARRLPNAAGFSLHFEGLSEMEGLMDARGSLTAMNGAIERLVNTDPAQYQWEYKRFKRAERPSDRVY